MATLKQLISATLDAHLKSKTDSALSSTSTNPVQSKAIKAAIDAKTFPVDTALSTTSTNAVQNKVISEALNTKANTSSLATVATSGSYNDLTNKPSGTVSLVSSYSSGTTWYRKYSDGWIEQGGYFYNSSRSTVHTFSLAFSSTNISLVFGEAGGGGVNTSTLPDHAAAVSIETLNTTGFTLYTGDDDSFNSAGMFWYACGY